MKNFLKLITPLIPAFLLGVGCNMTMKIPEESALEAKTYRSRCSLCHSLPHPRRHTAEQWTHLVDVMDKVSIKKKFPPLDEKTKSDILSYLHRNAR